MKKREEKRQIIRTGHNTKKIITKVKETCWGINAHAELGLMPTTKLVQLVFDFCEIYSGITFYPYQEQFSKRVIRSALQNDGQEITALFSRQGGKSETIATTVGGMMVILPQLANLPMFAADKRLQMFTDGLWVGIFAPSQRQAQITYNRLRSRMSSANAQAIFMEDDFRLEFDTSNGQTVSLTNGSFATAISSSDQSNIEGESFKLIIMEECQDISDYKITKCLVGDTKVLLDNGETKTIKEIVRDKEDSLVCYTPDYKEQTSQVPYEFYSNGVNKVYEMTLANGSKITSTINHKFVTYNQKTNGRKIKERTLLDIVQSMGNDRPLRVGVPDSLPYFAEERERDFSRGVCDGFETATFKEDLLGDTLYSKEFYRGYIQSLIDHAGKIDVENSQIVLYNLPEDLFLQLQSVLLKFGIHAMPKTKGYRYSLKIASKKDLQRFKDSFRLLKDKQALLEEIIKTAPRDTQEDGVRFYHVSSVRYVGEEETFCVNMSEEEDGIHNFIANNIMSGNSIHPMGAAYNSTLVKIGTPTTFTGNFYHTIQRNKALYQERKIPIRNHFEYNYKVIQKYNPKYEKYVDREKFSLGEDSDEFRMSYGLEWILERGMFVDLKDLERLCGDDDARRVLADKKATHIAGIDVASVDDRTVVTIIEVDWDTPAISETFTDPETGEEVEYEVYNTMIKDWAEIRSDYNSQHAAIMDYLSNYNIARVVIDATRESAVAHRLQANLKVDVVPFIFTTPSKSEIYKVLEREIRAGRCKFPNNKETQQTREHGIFLDQTSGLRKEYKGTHMCISPAESKGKDDYPDSWALAVYGATVKQTTANVEVIDGAEIFKPTPQKNRYMATRNRLTARRRR